MNNTEPSSASKKSNKSGFVNFLKAVYEIWVGERPTQFAAALAYYAIFSMVPVIYIAFTLANIFVSRLRVSERFFEQAAAMLGDSAALSMQEAVISLADRVSGGNPLASVFGFIALFFSGSMMFFQLQHALNTVLHVKPPGRDATREYIRGRLFAFLMVLGVTLILILSAVINLLLSTITSFFNVSSPLPMISLLIFGGLVIFSLAMIYKYLPSTHIAWRDVWAGSIFSGSLITIGIFLVGSFMGATRFQSATEAAGTLALFLTGFYFLGQFVILGAVITRVYARKFGGAIEKDQTQTQSN